MGWNLHNCWAKDYCFHDEDIWKRNVVVVILFCLSPSSSGERIVPRKQSLGSTSRWKLLNVWRPKLIYGGKRKLLNMC